MQITPEQLKNWFTYHAPTPEQQESYVAIRDAGLELAHIIVAHCPECADTTAAVRKVREAVAAANSAVACGGK